VKSRDVRQSFTDFFAARGHRPVVSAPLVPHGDPTLLFTNAGMVQFKDFFLGAAEPPSRRAVSVQKCLRVSGKHNDLENVGPSPRHHTFFEMLGNFSFGDYFKAEAIEYGWKLVTGEWGLDPAVLSATVYEEDDEAAELWRRITTLPASRIHRCGKKDNFWQMGDTGPCGPCSEIYVDRAPDQPAVDWQEGTDSGRYLEIWNLVFMQYDRSADGTLTPLPAPSVDTGAGLERVAAVLQGVDSNYDTDLFQPILRAAAALARTEYGADPHRDVSLRVIADHLRATSFLLADGVVPGNEGRGYVLRRILRRAVRHGMRLGFAEPFLHRLVPVLGEVMERAYPELGATRAATVATMKAEEEKFLATVAAASRQVQEEIEAAKGRGERAIPGESVFRFYDTHGLPLEVIREIAEEERFAVDEVGFDRAMSEQRARSRSVALGGTSRRARFAERLQKRGLAGKEAEPRAFVGLLETPDQRSSDGDWTTHATVQAVGRFVDDQPEFGLQELQQGADGFVALDRSILYGEAGGQVGDRGWITWPGGRALVTDTLLFPNGRYHFVTVESGALVPGSDVLVSVDPRQRLPTQRNHTATHLLHAALREVLGPGVRQAGSLVAPDRLRFDFSQPRGLTAEEVQRVEDRVNEWVLRAVDTRIALTTQREALAAGAMALFGEKYGERVRTVEVPGFSLELCGGCHVRNTGEIGAFVVLSEKGIASGVRRIEAITGEASLAWMRELREQLAQERAAGQEAKKASERELAAVRRRLLAAPVSQGPQPEAMTVKGIQVLAQEVPDAPAADLRALADRLRDRLGSGLVVLGARPAEPDGKATLLAALSRDLTGRLSAADVIRRIAPLIGGSGGGRPDFAQAGGKERSRLADALQAVAGAVEELAS
jgi:alanyl-tRNA synthetase